MGERGSNVFSANSVGVTFLSAGPQSKAACTHGGWRDPNFVDENGHHFSSQNDCTRYVARYLLNARASGHIGGDAPVAHFGDGCPYIHAKYAVTVDTDRGPDKALNMNICVDGNLRVTGTFRYVFPRGALIGTVTGTLDRSGEVAATLDVTRATRRLCKVDGTLELTVNRNYLDFDHAVGEVISHLNIDDKAECPPPKTAA
jgi:hypothetical protein